METAGVAFANWHYRTPECGVGVCGAYDNSRVGVVGGGGIEYMFQQNLSLRLEGLYYDFGTVRSPAGGVDVVPTDIHTRISVVRAGLTYHFGGPLSARY
jgi:outer membrane immunogenic protein